MADKTFLEVIEEAVANVQKNILLRDGEVFIRVPDYYSRNLLIDIEIFIEESQLINMDVAKKLAAPRIRKSLVETFQIDIDKLIKDLSALENCTWCFVTYADSSRYLMDKMSPKQPIRSIKNSLSLFSSILPIVPNIKNNVRFQLVFHLETESPDK